MVWSSKYGRPSIDTQRLSSSMGPKGSSNCERSLQKMNAVSTTVSSKFYHSLDNPTSPPALTCLQRSHMPGIQHIPLYTFYASSWTREGSTSNVVTHTLTHRTRNTHDYLAWTIVFFPVNILPFRTLHSDLDWFTNNISVSPPYTVNPASPPILWVLLKSRCTNSYFTRLIHRCHDPRSISSTLYHDFH